MSFLPDTAFHYIEKAWHDQRLGHAYIVAGLDAPDRLEFALRVAHLVNGGVSEDITAMADEGVHVLEPESKSRKITVDQIRALERTLHMRAGSGRTKLGVVVDADRMNPNSANAFLKTLEEPPQQSLLLLLTAMPDKLLDTVVSRCIRISLHRAAPPDPSDRPEEESALLLALASHFKAPPSASKAMGLLSIFTALLGQMKDDIASENAAEQKRESDLYSKTTDASSWLKGRKDYYEALTESQYQKKRARFLEILQAWFGDLLRARQGLDRADFPEFAAVTAAAAKGITTSELLRRLKCLQDLEGYMETNVSESLAMELAFLGAFS